MDKIMIPIDMLAELLEGAWSAGASCGLAGLAREYAAKNRISGLVMQAVEYARETEAQANVSVVPASDRDFASGVKPHLRG